MTASSAHRSKAKVSPQSSVLQHNLRESIADLRKVNFWVGFWRFVGLGLALGATIGLVWTCQSKVSFVFWTMLSGLLYAGWLVCTHDMTHHTLLGTPAVEAGLARLVAWPMFWPVGVYAELHRLHHGWNGLDLRDPERVQWTETEYQQAHPWMQFYVRHQWLIDVFVLGGWGLTLHTLIQGYRCRSCSPRLKQRIAIDLIGMFGAQAIIVMAVVLSNLNLWQYLLFWLLLERTIGVIMQIRGHLEHEGLWQQTGGHLTTQLYAGRNFEASKFISGMIGGLNYHAVHHAFPDIPFDQLPLAYRRIQIVLDHHGLPLMGIEQNYLSTAFKLMRQASQIPSPGQVSDLAS